MSPPLPVLPPSIEATRFTLHAYARAVSSVPRAHGVFHHRWWHVGMTVCPDGLMTDSVPLADGRALAIRMDLRTHRIHFEASDGPGPAIDMRAGLTGSEMAARVIDIVSGYGLDGPFDESRFVDDRAGEYRPEDATALFAAFVAADQVFVVHQRRLRGETAPVHLWPHGFDLACEWFGTRMVQSQEGGEEASAQINLGFYPQDPAYFYSNPWPFDGDLVGIDLPAGAAWHTDGWQGSILYYDQVAGRPDGRRLVLEYARAVHEAAAPGLTA